MNKHVKACSGKLCKGAILPLAAFGVRKDTGRLRPWCRECEAAAARAGYAKMRTKRLKQKQRYYAANKERISAYRANYYQQNREKALAAAAAFRANNRDRVRQYNKAYRVTHREKVNAAKRHWQRLRRRRRAMERLGLIGGVR